MPLKSIIVFLVFLPFTLSGQIDKHIEVQIGHFAGARALSHDGRLIATGGGNNIKIWDVNQRKIISTIDGFYGFPQKLFFSNKNNTLVSAWDDFGSGQLVIWDVDADTLKSWTIFPSSINDFKISKSNEYYVFAGGRSYGTNPSGFLMVLHESKGIVIDLKDLPKSMMRVEFDAEEKQLITLSARQNEVNQVDNEVSVWDLETGQLVQSVNTYKVTHMDVDILRNEIALGESDGDLIIKNIPDLKTIRNFSYGTPISTLKYRNNAESNLIVGVGSISTNLNLVNPLDGEILKTAPDLGHMVLLNHSYGPKEDKLIAGSENKIKIFNLDDFKEEVELEVERVEFTGIATNSDGRRLAVSSGATAMFSNDFSIRSWDFLNGKLNVLFGHESPVSKMNFSPDGSRLISGDQSGKIVEWNLHTLTSHPVVNIGAEVTGLFYTSKNDEFIVLDRNGILSKYNIGELETKASTNFNIYAPVMDENRKRIAALNADNEVVIIDVEQMKVLDILDSPLYNTFHLDFSPNGKFLTASNSRSSFVVWDLEDDQKPYFIKSGMNGSRIQSKFDNKNRLWTMDQAIGSGYIYEVNDTAENEAERIVQVQDVIIRDDVCSDFLFVNRGAFVAMLDRSGKISIYNTDEHKKLADLYSIFVAGNLIVSPSGYYLADDFVHPTVSIFSNNIELSPEEKLKYHNPNQIFTDLGFVGEYVSLRLGNGKELPSNIVSVDASEIKSKRQEYKEVKFLLSTAKTSNKEAESEIIPQIPHSGTDFIMEKSEKLGLLATGDDDGNIKLWDLKTKKLLKTLNDQEHGIRELIFNENNNKLISICGQTRSFQIDSTIIWDLNTFEKFKMPPNSLINFTPDQSKIAIAYNKYKTGESNYSHVIGLIHDGSPYTNLSFETHGPEINQLVYTKDGSYLIVAFSDGSLKIFDTKDYSTQFASQAHEGKILKMRISDDDGYLVTLGEDMVIKCFSLKTNTLKKLWSKKVEAKDKSYENLGTILANVNSIRISPDDQKVYCLHSNDKMAVYKLKNGKLTKSYDFENSYQQSYVDNNMGIVAIDFEFDNSQNTLYSGENGQPITLDVDQNSWEYLTRDLENTLFDIGFEDSTGNLVYYDNSTIFSWNLKELNKVESITEDFIPKNVDSGYSTLLGDKFWKSDNGLFLKLSRLKDYQSNNVYHEIDVFDIYNKSEKTNFKLKKVFDRGEILDYCPATQMLAISSDISKGEEILFFDKEGNNIFSYTINDKYEFPDVVEFSHDGKFVFIHSEYHYRIKVYGTDTWTEVFSYRPKRWNSSYASILNQTNLLFYAEHNDYSSEDIFKIIDLNSNGVKYTLDQEMANKISQVSKSSYSPDLNLLAVNEFPERVHIIDLERGEIVKSFKQKGSITSIDFSSNGELLLVGSFGSYASCWNVASEELVFRFQPLDNGNYIFTNDGYYYGSKLIGDKTAFRVNNKVYSFEQFDLIRNRPDLLLQKIPNFSEVALQNYNKAYDLRLSDMGLSEAQLSTSFHTPSVEILNESIPAFTKEKSFTVQFSMLDTLYNLDRIFLYVNDTPHFGLNGDLITHESGSPYNGEIEINLQSGFNKIQLSCLNSVGVESYKETIEIQYLGEAEDPKMYVVSIGVSEYEDKTKRLHYPEKDAKFLAQFLYEKSGFATDTMVLVNDQFSKDKMAKLRQFLSEAREEDIVVFYLSGHGVRNLDTGNYYFCPYNFKSSDFDEHGIPFVAFEELLSRTKSRQKLFILNTCYSGNYSNVKTYDELKNFNFMQSVYLDLRKRSGTSILSGSGGVTTAKEIIGIKSNNGLMVQAIEDAFKNIYNLSVSELCRHVQKKTPEFGFPFLKGDQVPVIRFENFSSDFKISKD